MNAKVYFWALAIVAVLIKECESVPTIEVEEKALSQNYAVLELTLSDNTNLEAATVTLTTPASAPNVVKLESDFTIGAASQSLALYGLSAATNYVLTLGTAKHGTTAFSPDPTVSFCTAADPLTGLEVDSTGTTAEAIKIKWNSVSTAKYKVYLDNMEVDGDVAADSSDFTYDATTLTGKGVELNSEKAQMCKVEVVLSVTGCGDSGEVTTIAEIECGVTGAAGSGTDCKSSAKMFYPVLTFAAVVFSMMAL